MRGRMSLGFGMGKGDIGKCEWVYEVCICKRGYAKDSITKS
jgi:hypothetical protein